MSAVLALPASALIEKKRLNIWTGCLSQVRWCWIAEVAYMYPACLIGSWAVALMGNTHAPLVSLAEFENFSRS